MATRTSTSDVLILCNSQSSAGVGASAYWPDQFGHIQSFSQWTLMITGNGTGLSIKLNGSLDGKTWFDSGTTAVTGNGLSKFLFTSAVPYIQVNVVSIATGSVTVQAVGVS